MVPGAFDKNPHQRKMENISIINLTPHHVNIMTNALFVPEIRKQVQCDITEVLLTWPASGVLANAKIQVTEETTINGNIPVRSQKLRKEPIPLDLTYVDGIIVSAMFASAPGDVVDINGNVFTGEVFTIGDMVVDANDHQKVIGCATLIRNQ